MPRLFTCLSCVCCVLCVRVRRPLESGMLRARLRAPSLGLPVPAQACPGKPCLCSHPQAQPAHAEASFSAVVEVAPARLAGSQHRACDTRTHFGCYDGAPEVCRARLWDFCADRRLPGLGTARLMAVMGTATCPEKGLGAREGLKVAQSGRGGRWGWHPTPAHVLSRLLSAFPPPLLPFFIFLFPTCVLGVTTVMSVPR